jgi:hypothetical protein
MEQIMKPRAAAWVALGLLAAQGCGEPVVDASSPEKLRESTDAVRDKLPEDKRENFNDALMTVILQNGGNTQTLNGLTAAEIIQQAEAKSKEDNAEHSERQQKRQRDIAQNNAYLDAVEIVMPPLQELLATPVTEHGMRAAFWEGQITVRNPHPQAISQITVRLTVHVAGRSTPSHESEHYITIDSGVEPNEKRTIKQRLDVVRLIDDAKAAVTDFPGKDLVATWRVDHVSGANGDGHSRDRPW